MHCSQLFDTQVWLAARLLPAHINDRDAINDAAWTQAASAHARPPTQPGPSHPHLVAALAHEELDRVCIRRASTARRAPAGARHHEAQRGLQVAGAGCAVDGRPGLEVAQLQVCSCICGTSSGQNSCVCGTMVHLLPEGPTPK